MIQQIYYQVQNVSRQSIFTLLFFQLINIYFFSKSFLLPFHQCLGASYLILGEKWDFNIFISELFGYWVKLKQKNMRKNLNQSYIRLSYGDSIYSKPKRLVVKLYFYILYSARLAIPIFKINFAISTFSNFLRDVQLK